MSDSQGQKINLNAPQEQTTSNLPTRNNLNMDKKTSDSDKRRKRMAYFQHGAVRQAAIFQKPFADSQVPNAFQEEDSHSTTHPESSTSGQLQELPTTEDYVFQDVTANTFGPSMQQVESQITTQERSMCVICRTERTTHLVVPCGHKIYCRNCAQKQEVQAEKLCPVCNDEQTMIIKLREQHLN